MLFETGRGLKIVSPSNEEIETHLGELAALGQDWDNFVILLASQEGNDFMQASIDDTNVFHIEYRDQHMKKHFGAENIPANTAVVLFQLYNATDTSWKTTIVWQDMSSEFEW